MAALNAWGLRLSQRTTRSEEQIRQSRGKSQRRGILIGVWDETDVPDELWSSVSGRAGAVGRPRNPLPMQRLGSAEWQALRARCYGRAPWIPRPPRLPTLSPRRAFAPARARACCAEPSQAIFDPRSGRALGPSDWDLSPEFLGDLAVMAPPRPAAVLVPIVLRDELTVLLTQRAHDMPSHPGQISFPGGKIEECDTTPIDCALREAREEIGLDGRFVEPLGYLDSYRTGTGFQISPVVAFVRPGFTVVLDAREVLEVFEVPLAFLMDEANHQKHSREWRGRQRFFYAMPYRGTISGAPRPACSRTCARGCFSA